MEQTQVQAASCSKENSLNPNPSHRPEWNLNSFQGHRRTPSETYSDVSSSSCGVYMPPTPNDEGFDYQDSFLPLADPNSGFPFSVDVHTSKFEMGSPKLLPQLVADYGFQPCADRAQFDLKTCSTATSLLQNDFVHPKISGASEEERRLSCTSQTKNEEIDGTSSRGSTFTERSCCRRVSLDESMLRPSEQRCIENYSEELTKENLEVLGVYAAKDTPSTEVSSGTIEFQAGEFSDSEWWSETSSPESARPASISGLLPFAREVASTLLDKFLTQRRGAWWTRGHARNSSNSSVASDLSSTTTLSSTSSLQSSGKGAESLLGTSRKRPSDDDDDRRPTQRRRLESSSRDFKGQLLACPFAKNKPLKHAKCFKYMIQEIARLKQHILRVHQVPIHCARCSQVFVTEDERDTHFRETSVCIVQPARLWDGVSEAQRRQLAKRVSSKKSKEENWYLIYEIMFPNSPKPDSPYIDNVQLSEELLALREFTMQEAPARISAFALSQIPEELRSSQDQVEAFTRAAVRDLFDMVIEQWLNREHSPDALAAALNADSTNGSGSFCFDGGNSSSSSTQQECAEQLVAQTGNENTVQLSTLSNSLFETTYSEDSRDTLDWFLPLENHEFSF